MLCLVCGLCLSNEASFSAGPGDVNTYRLHSAVATTGSGANISQSQATLHAAEGFKWYFYERYDCRYPQHTGLIVPSSSAPTVVVNTTIYVAVYPRGDGVLHTVDTAGTTCAASTGGCNVGAKPPATQPGVHISIYIGLGLGGVVSLLGVVAIVIVCMGMVRAQRFMSLSASLQTQASASHALSMSAATPPKRDEASEDRLQRYAIAYRCSQHQHCGSTATAASDDGQGRTRAAVGFGMAMIAWYTLAQQGLGTLQRK